MKNQQNKKNEKIVIMLSADQKERINSEALRAGQALSPWSLNKLLAACELIEDRREARMNRLRLMGTEDWEEQGIGRVKS